MNMLCIGTGIHHIGMKVSDKDIYISYLPLAHSLEWTVVHVVIMHGAQIGFFGGDV